MLLELAAFCGRPTNACCCMFPLFSSCIHTCLQTASACYSYICYICYKQGRYMLHTFSIQHTPMLLFFVFAIIPLFHCYKTVSMTLLELWTTSTETSKIHHTIFCFLLHTAYSHLSYVHCKHRPQGSGFVNLTSDMPWTEIVGRSNYLV